MPSSKILEMKKAQVTVLAEKFKKAKVVVLVDYRGINVEDDTKLRKTLREENSEYLVTKNSIIKFAAKEAGIEGFDTLLEGPTSVAIGYEDYVAVPKAVYEQGKDKEFFNIKGGAMDGKTVSKDEIEKLAKLPSREVLLTMLASSLLGNIRNLAVVLDQVKTQKEDTNA